MNSTKSLIKKKMGNKLFFGVLLLSGLTATESACTEVTIPPAPVTVVVKHAIAFPSKETLFTSLGFAGALIGLKMLYSGVSTMSGRGNQEQAQQTNGSPSQQPSFASRTNRGLTQCSFGAAALITGALTIYSNGRR